MSERRSILGALGGAVLAGLAAIAGPGAAQAFTICGFHDRPFTMRAYHNGPSLFADLAIREAVRWNAVHSILRVSRVAETRVPASSSDGSVVSCPMCRACRRRWRRRRAASLG